MLVFVVYVRVVAVSMVRSVMYYQSNLGGPRSISIYAVHFAQNLFVNYPGSIIK
jgi:hypothetical protein